MQNYMSQPKQSNSHNIEKRPQQVKKQSEPQFGMKGNKMEASIRPIIDTLQRKIQSEFMQLHNKYLLQGFKRKVNCYHKFIKPPAPVVTELKSTKTTEKTDNQPIPTELQVKASPQQVLQYYKCFDEQVELGTRSYQKINKKSQENRIRLVNCIEKCSGHSKGLSEEYMNCEDKCRNSYIKIMTKLYANFYQKFIDHQ